MSPVERIYRQFSGAKLRAAREAIGISRDRLAPFIGCTTLSLYNWETGKRTPSARHLDALAVQLRQTVDYFYDVSEPYNKDGDAKG